ncbi:hypothetical protein BGX34_006666, partial [Mortierella sp. NVP85]
ISLEDIQKIPGLSFLGFTKLVFKNFGQDGRMKSTVNNRYLKLATEASKSDDKKTAEDGKKMLGLFKTELEQVEAFWSHPQLDREGRMGRDWKRRASDASADDGRGAKRTRLYVRLSDVVGPGTRSCDLHLEPLVINGRSISKELMDLRKSYFDQERKLETMDDLLVMNFIFTEKLLREHFGEYIASELASKEDIPPLSEADSQYLTTVVQMAPQKDVHGFQAFLGEHPADGVEESLRELFEGLSRTHDLWRHNDEDDVEEPYRRMNNKTYLFNILDPILGAFFRDMRVVRSWTNFLAREQNLLTMLIVKQTAHGIKERHRAKDERELLFCMKVSLDLLMKLNVKDPEVVGILAR